MTTEEARKKLIKMKPFLVSCSLSAARISQVAIGAVLFLPRMKGERFERLVFPSFPCGLITPEDGGKDPEALIIYLHGGGYVAGGIDYARGFASVLTELTGLRVLFPAYRLAPEHKCPTALKDCLNAYRYAIKNLEVPPEKIILCGESAGGGLIYSLLRRVKELKLPLPAGVIAISPWTDLTMSGESYEWNAENDPSMTRERLKEFADCYADDPEDPDCSPIFGDLSSMPPSLILSGGDEIMLSDALTLKEKLIEGGSVVRHVIAEGMWHAYPLYRLSDREEDDRIISDFVKEILSNEEKSPLDEA